jgi:hypothetical protein
METWLSGGGGALVWSGVKWRGILIELAPTGAETIERKKAGKAN